MADESPSVALNQAWKSWNQYTGVAVYEFPDAVGSEASARVKINNLRLWTNRCIVRQQKEGTIELEYDGL